MFLLTKRSAFKAFRALLISNSFCFYTHPSYPIQPNKRKTNQTQQEQRRRLCGAIIQTKKEIRKVFACFFVYNCPINTCMVSYFVMCLIRDVCVCTMNFTFLQMPCVHMSRTRNAAYMPFAAAGVCPLRYFSPAYLQRCESDSSPF